MSIKQPASLPISNYKRPIRIETGGRVATTHQAMIVDSEGAERRAYVKHFGSDAPRGMFNEWIGYTVMSALGIPQPETAVMPAPVGGQGPVQWAFVSFVPAPNHEGTPKEVYNLADAGHIEVLAERLLACHSFAAMVAADQLCMNGDRNLGNLVFTGKRSFVVIDHGDILGGRDWHLDSLLRPTGWIASKPIGFCDQFGKLKKAHCSAIYAASQICCEQLWRTYSGLASGVSPAGREAGIALDAVWWRSLTLAQWFRDELKLAL